MAVSFPPFPLFAFPRMIAIWRRPARGGAHAPLVVVLHGRGDDENGLLPVIDRLAPAFTYVSVRGLVNVEDGGYTWFENRGVARPIAKSLRESVSVVRTWLDEVSPLATGRRVYLLGFSAGMMMAGALLLDDPQRFAGAILLSGALPLESGIAAGPDRLAAIPIFYARGKLDDVIPAGLVMQSERYLRERSGAVFAPHEYDHGHSISLPEIRDIAAWLNERH